MLIFIAFIVENSIFIMFEKLRYSLHESRSQKHDSWPKLDLYQRWSFHNSGPISSCNTIHPHTSCPYEVIAKMIKVMKSSFKMYALLHTILFFLKFRKFKQEKRLKNGIQRTIKNFIGSLLFMSWLTGGMKSSLCLLNSFGCFLNCNEDD